MKEKKTFTYFTGFYLNWFAERIKRRFCLNIISTHRHHLSIEMIIARLGSKLLAPYKMEWFICHKNRIILFFPLDRFSEFHFLDHRFRKWALFSRIFGRFEMLATMAKLEIWASLTRILRNDLVPRARIERVWVIDIYSH